jgi:hypothetical protein
VDIQIVFSPEELTGHISKISDLYRKPPNLHHLLVSGQITAYKYFPTVPGKTAREYFADESKSGGIRCMNIFQAHYRRCLPPEISAMVPHEISDLFVDENQLEIPAQVVAPVQVVEADRRTFIKSGDVWVIGFKEHEINLKHNIRILYLAHLLAHPGRSFDLLELSGLVSKKSAATGMQEVAEEWQSGKNAGVKTTMDQLNTMPEAELNEEGLSSYNQYQENDDTTKRHIDAFRKIAMDIIKAKRDKNKFKENELIAQRNQLSKILRDDYGTKMVKVNGYWTPKQLAQLKDDAKKARSNVTMNIKRALDDIEEKSKPIFDAIKPFIYTGDNPIYGVKGQPPPPSWDVKF